MPTPSRDRGYAAPPLGVAEQRRAILRLSTEARRELSQVWLRLSRLPGEQIRDALAEVLPALCEKYGLAAGTLAADWYDTLREHQARAAGSTFRAAPVDLPDAGRYEALARWGVGPLFRAEPDPGAAQTLIAGGVQRIIANQHRLTIARATYEDPRAVGWMRVGDGASCGFCRMLIDRGGVYAEATVMFRTHDYCTCAAAPSWDPESVRVSSEPFRQSRRRRSEATKARDNARAKQYIAANYGDQ